MTEMNKLGNMKTIFSFIAVFPWGGGHGEGAGACPRCKQVKAPAHQLLAGPCVSIWVIAHGHLSSALKVY